MGTTRGLSPRATEYQDVYPSVLCELGPGSLYLNFTYFSSREAADEPTAKDWHHPCLHDWVTVSLISCRLSLWLGGSLSTTLCSACLGSILSIYYRVQLERTLDGSWGIIEGNTATYVSSTVPPARGLLA